MTDEGDEHVERVQDEEPLERVPGEELVDREQDPRDVEGKPEDDREDLTDIADIGDGPGHDERQPDGEASPQQDDQRQLDEPVKSDPFGVEEHDREHDHGVGPELEERAHRNGKRQQEPREVKGAQQRLGVVEGGPPALDDGLEQVECEESDGKEREEVRRSTSREEQAEDEGVHPDAKERR